MAVLSAFPYTQLNMQDTSLAFTDIGDSADLVFDWSRPLPCPPFPVSSSLLVWDFSEQRRVLRRLCRSLVSVHRETAVLPDLNTILEKVADAVEKVYTECRRVGAISSKAKFELPASSAISTRYAAQQLTTGFQTMGKLLNGLSLFLEKYKGEPICMLNYLNMNRISKAERLLAQAFEKVKSVLQLTYALRFQSLGQAFLCAVRIRNRLKREKHYESMELPAVVERPKTVSRQLPPPIESPEDSFQQGLFTKTNEEQVETLWPASPIGILGNAEISLNTSVASVVAQLPKTIFTPAIALKPPKDIHI